MILGQANDVVDYIEAVPTRCANGVDVARLARQGRFVHRSLALQDADVVASAPNAFRAPVARILWPALETARKAGQLPLGRNVATLEGAQGLQPANWSTRYTSRPIRKQGTGQLGDLFRSASASCARSTSTAFQKADSCDSNECVEYNAFT